MTALLAQANNNFNNGPFNGNDNEVLIVVLIVVGILLVIGLIVTIFFLMMLSKTLSRCAPENRTMEPGMVWLNLIPCVSLVWQFITVSRVAESLDNEFYDRGWDQNDDYGRSLGTTTCVLNLLGIIPYIGGLFSLGWLVCGIIYWVKIAGYSKQLAAGESFEGDDDEDERPRKKKKRRDEYDDEDDRDDDGSRGHRDWN